MDRSAGENGLAACSCRCSLSPAGPAALRELLPWATGWPRHDAPFGEVTATIQWTEGDAQLPRWPKKSPYSVRFAVTGSDVERLPDALKQEGVEAVVDWPGPATSSARERETVSKAMSRLRQTAYAESKDGVARVWVWAVPSALYGGSQDADQILYAERRAAEFVTLFEKTLLSAVPRDG